MLFRSLENAALASSSGRDDLHDFGGGKVGPHVAGVTHRSVGTHSFASVVARDCMTADALTNIVLALGPQAGAILRANDATAYFHDDGHWKTLGAVQ